MPTRGSPKDSRKTGKGTPGLLDLDDVEGFVEIFTDSDDCLDDDLFELSTSVGAFSSRQDVFVVRGLSKAVTGFRPAVTCAGFLAHVSRTSSGYTLLPRGSDQQLSFKYEPPSPKFSGSRPSCISYRLQLLHGSQFLYSLRGLPKVLRCQRAAQALEWGPVHLVFAAAADLDTFLATLKYVEVEEMTPEAEDGQQSGGGTAAEAPRQQPSAGASAAAATAPAGAACRGAGGRGTAACGCGAPWPSAAAMLWKEGSRGQGSTAAASGSCSCRVNCAAPLFAATAGTAVLAAVAAACLLTQRGGGTAPGRKRIAESAAKMVA